MLAFKLKTRSAIKNKLIRLYEFAVLSMCSVRQPVMPDDHSKLVPLLPIPNRTVKRLSADDSADSRVKVGHRQALTACNAPNLIQKISLGVLLFRGRRHLFKVVPADPTQ